MNLPDIDGWRVLDHLKDDVLTRHIPVHLITTDEERDRGLRMGAMGALAKPIKTKESLDETFARIRTFTQTNARKVLIVASDPPVRHQIAETIGEGGIEIVHAESAAHATALLSESPFDLVITGMDLPDQKTFDMIDELKEKPELRDLRVIVYGNRELSKKETIYLKRLSQTMPLKEVRSLERLRHAFSSSMSSSGSAALPIVMDDYYEEHAPGGSLQSIGAGGIVTLSVA